MACVRHRFGGAIMRKVCSGVLAALFMAISPELLRAQDEEPRAATSTVFARYGERILKVQVIATGSSAQASIGTGFFVTGDGLMMTNYHVVSEHVHEPDNYRVEIVDGDGESVQVEVIAIDVVRDLAVLRTGLAPREHFGLDSVTVPQGERLYSLGYPSDLPLSIVEGTYNGNLKHTLYPKIHFTGSINPGMSGGPTITDAGRVVGVNVSTMGNQRSFLVPRADAAALLAQVTSDDFEPIEDMMAVIRDQLYEYQNEYITDLLAEDTKLVEIGRFSVPTEPNPVFRCWGDSDRRAERLYEFIWHSCSTDDDLYVADGQWFSMVDIEHEILTDKSLGKTRFSELYSRRFAMDNTPGGRERHVTKWECSTRNVRTESATTRSVLCLRRLRKFEGLYDAVLKVAVLGPRDTGLVSTLTLSASSFENIDTLTQRYIGLISWQ